MNPIYNLRHKIQMLKDFLQLLSTGPVTLQNPISYSGEEGESLKMLDKGAKTWKCLTKSHIIYFNEKVLLVKCLEKQPC